MERLRGIKQKYETFEADHPVALSIGEAAVTFLLKKGVKELGEKAGLKLQHGRTDNPTRNEFIENHPVAAATLATVAAPIGEELLYRHFPAGGMDRAGVERGSKRRALAELGLAFLFAAQHAGKDGLPVPQLIGGLVYQRAHRRRGFKGSVAAHITNNALAVGEAVYRRKKSR